ncbi:hypothetical protein scyTo_0019414, partial [Scyliorhinus torazame]|nr:hypothetical protein [Scyliorhinus torazame]
VFLIPYTLMLALVGMPVFFLECSFGQFASLGPVAGWKAVPIMQGMGITMVLVTSISNILYTVIIAYSLYYLFASFQSPLPWTDCFSWWGADETCSRTPKEIYVHHQGPSEQYWDKVVLRRTSSMDETGEIVWYLALCLLLAWLIVGAALSKGIKSSGKRSGNREAGVYWLSLIDYFCTGWVLITIALLELISLSWIYGVNRFIKDIEMMIGKRNWLFWLWWRGCWIFISPCLLAVILIWSLTTFTPPTYGPIEYPVWAIALGWCLINFCIMWIPIVAIVRVVQAEGATLCQ